VTASGVMSLGKCDFMYVIGVYVQSDKKTQVYVTESTISHICTSIVHYHTKHTPSTTWLR